MKRLTNWINNYRIILTILSKKCKNLRFKFKNKNNRFKNNKFKNKTIKIKLRINCNQKNKSASSIKKMFSYYKKK